MIRKASSERWPLILETFLLRKTLDSILLCLGTPSYRLQITLSLLSLTANFVNYYNMFMFFCHSFCTKLESLVLLPHSYFFLSLMPPQNWQILFLYASSTLLIKCFIWSYFTQLNFNFLIFNIIIVPTLKGPCED